MNTVRDHKRTLTWPLRGNRLGAHILLAELILDAGWVNELLSQDLVNLSCSHVGNLNPFAATHRQHMQLGSVHKVKNVHPFHCS